MVYAVQLRLLVLVPQGVPTFLVLTVTGLPQEEGLSFSHVTLLGVHGEKLQTVTLNSSSSSFFPSVDQLVGRLDSVPKDPFCVQLTGQDNAGNKFERVSTEMVHPTHVQIQVAPLANQVDVKECCFTCSLQQ